MLTEANAAQRQKLLALQKAWSEFKEESLLLGPGVDGGAMKSDIKRLDELIESISHGPESWAKGSEKP